MTPRRPSRRQGETRHAGQDATRRDPRRGRGGRGQAPHPRLQDRQDGRRGDHAGRRVRRHLDAPRRRDRGAPRRRAADPHLARLQARGAAGRELGLPTVVEILDPGDVPVYEDAGVDCIQIGEPNSKNQALLNRLRSTPLPVIHKRGNSLDTEAYLLWVERMMTGGKENVILCERGIASANRYTRNTLDCGSIAAYRYQLSGLPIAVDASHGTGIRDLVHPATLAGIMAGASVVLVEAHPNPLIAKSDGFQGLFPEQLRALVRAAREAWRLRRELDRSYLASPAVERDYMARMQTDRERLFKS